MNKISEFEIALSYKCSTQCAFCYANCSPNFSKVIDLPLALRCINSISSEYKLRTIGLLGGEPTLHRPVLLSLISQARANNIPNIMMFTNGEWGRNISEIEKMCFELKNAGLTEIILSVDYFHQLTIPLENCLQIASKATENGLRVRFSMCCLENISSDNIVDKRNREIQGKISSLLNVPIQYQTLRFFGRASKLITHYPKLHSATEVNHPCLHKDFFGSLQCPTGFLIDCFGHVQICDGISIGNVYSQPLNKIIQNYSVKDNIILKTLFEEGPIGLNKFNQEIEFKKSKNLFVDNCHLCYYIRKLIHKKFSDVLSPQHFYS